MKILFYYLFTVIKERFPADESHTSDDSSTCEDKLVITSTCHIKSGSENLGHVSMATTDLNNFQHADESYFMSEDEDMDNGDDKGETITMNKSRSYKILQFSLMRMVGVDANRTRPQVADRGTAS